MGDFMVEIDRKATIDKQVELIHRMVDLIYGEANGILLVEQSLKIALGMIETRPKLRLVECLVPPGQTDSPPPRAS